MSATPPFAALATAPGLARGHVRATLAEWGLGELAEAAELIASEMTANAVNASAPVQAAGDVLVIRVCLLANGDVLAIECWDQAPGVPVLRAASGLEESGRGLAIIDSLTDGAWGCQPAIGQAGKCVWAEIPVRDVPPLRSEPQPFQTEPPPGHQVSRSSLMFDALTADAARGRMPDRFASVIDVHVILRRAGRVLLLRRAGDVYASGQLCLPSGHMEQGESICQAAVRETLEETGIILDHAALHHVLSIHQRNPGTADTRIGFAFTASGWAGEPVNAEPHKHSELMWADPAVLPADTAEYTAAVITAVERGLTFTLNGW